jgi:1,4-alpha-glucan branching enzyme
MTTKPKKTTASKTPRTSRKTTTATPATSEPATTPPAPKLPRVRFSCRHAGASAVYLAGTFNQWHPTATPMRHVGEGRWEVELELPPGVYEYRFIVDGVWLHDPEAVQSVPNPFGGLNSVVTVSET